MTATPTPLARLGASERDDMADPFPIVRDLAHMWRELPRDLQQQILTTVRQTWMVRGSVLDQVLGWVAMNVVRTGMPVFVAVRRAGPRFGLVPRSPEVPKVTDRVRRYHERQLARGRIPGRDPRLRRRHREAESMAASSSVRPRIAEVCRIATARAATLRRAAVGADARTRAGLRREANRFVKRWGNDLLSGRHALTTREIDVLVGCLAALEHAVRGGVPAMNGVRARAARLVEAIGA